MGTKTSKIYRVSELYLLTIKFEIPVCYCGDYPCSIREVTEYFIASKVALVFCDIFSGVELRNNFSEI